MTSSSVKLKDGVIDRHLPKDLPVVDRWLIWAVSPVLLFPIGLILIWSGPFGLAFAGAPILLIVWGVGAGIWLTFMLRAILERTWRRAVSWMVFPAFTLAAACNSDFVWGAAITAGDTIHFTVMRGVYQAEVAKLPTDQGPRFGYIDWGGFVVSHIVVYDESDEIFLPEDRQSESWKKKIAGTELACGILAVTPAGNHFYIVRTGC